MEQKYLNNEEELNKAIAFFGKKYADDILEIVKSYPCVLIGHYCDDIEWGDYYAFDVVHADQFKQTEISDEEIKQEANKVYDKMRNSSDSEDVRQSKTAELMFLCGACWYRNKLKTK